MMPLRLPQSSSDLSSPIPPAFHGHCRAKNYRESLIARTEPALYIGRSFKFGPGQVRRNSTPDFRACSGEASCPGSCRRGRRNPKDKTGANQKLPAMEQHTWEWQCSPEERRALAVEARRKSVERHESEDRDIADSLDQSRIQLWRAANPEWQDILAGADHLTK